MRPKTGSEILAKNIKRLRRKYGLTQEQLAEKADISLPLLQKIENVAVLGSMATHEKIAKVLEVSVSNLVYGDDGRPKSRIPDLQPDEPPLTPDEEKYLEDPYGAYLSFPTYSKLSNKQRRVIVNLIKSMLEEDEEDE